MYQVLIVDDERMIRVSIRKRVDWSKLGLTVSGMVSNGLEAIQLIEKNPPDIVLVDIRMPLLDGLSLIKELRRRGFNKIQFIVISGYNDFLYAQQAIRLGVKDYIQKPIDEVALEATLHEIVCKLDNDYYLKCEHDTENFSLSHINISQDIYCLKSLLIGQKENIQLSKPFADAKCYCLCMVIQRDSLNSALAIKSLNQELDSFDSSQIHVVFEDVLVPKKIWILFAGEKLSPELLLHSISKNSGFDAVITSVFTNIDELQRMNDLVYVNMARRLFFHEKPYIKICDSNNRPSQKQSEFFHEAINRLNTHIHNQDIKKIDEIIGRIFKEWLIPEASPVLVTSFVAALINLLYFVKIEDLSAKPPVINPDDLVLQASTMDELCAALVTCAANVLDKKEHQSSTDIIDRICLHIDNNYNKDLTLTNIAKQFYIHPNYLSQIFKQKSGKGYSEYIESIRMEKAKVLLGKLNYSVVDAATKVGFTDANYFSKVFKKNTGVTPTQFQSEAEQSETLMGKPV